MAYTTDYYDVLGLEAPSWVSRRNISTAEMRRAYKVALLAAHPDKKSNMDGKQMRISGEKGGGGGRYTIDEVKAAYMILSKEKSKADYDKWLLLHSASTLPPSLAQQQAQNPSSDFVLGLEIIDLGDFDVFEYPATTATTTTTTTNNNTSPSSSTSTANSSDDSGDDGSMRMEWTKGCRCGADKGFRIREEELEDAERRGDREVLVGCEGCSLWVRVEFDVEDEEEGRGGG